MIIKDTVASNKTNILQILDIIGYEKYLALPFFLDLQVVIVPLAFTVKEIVSLG